MTSTRSFSFFFIFRDIERRRDAMRVTPSHVASSATERVRNPRDTLAKRPSGPLHELMERTFAKLKRARTRTGQLRAAPFKDHRSRPNGNTRCGCSCLENRMETPDACGTPFDPWHFDGRDARARAQSPHSSRSAPEGHQGLDMHAAVLLKSHKGASRLGDWDLSAPGKCVNA